MSYDRGFAGPRGGWPPYGGWGQGSPPGRGRPFGGGWGFHAPEPPRGGQGGWQGGARYDRGYGGAARGPAGGYGRGIYGEAYPGFGGPPGGGGHGGSDAAWGRPSRSRGYDAWSGGTAREPFVPEEAYRRHPEMQRGPVHDPDAYGRSGGREDYGERDEDGEVLRGVCERMQRDSWLDAERIQVQVDDGVVTLRGEVDDFLEARYAWDDAWETPGVRGVVSQLTVRVDVPGDPTKPDAFAQDAG